MQYTAEQTAKLLKEFIEKTGTSVYRIEKDSGVHRETIKRYLTNGGYDPQVSTNNKILNYLGYVGYIEKR
jgi:DNA-binding phage protein